MNMKNNAHLQKLTRWIIQNFNADRAHIKNIEKLNGGAIQENWKIDVEINGGKYNGNHQWVLRKNAHSKLKLSLKKEHEFKILEIAQKYGIKVPEAIAICTNQKYIDTSFYIMRYIPGIAQARHIIRHPKLKQFGTKLVRQLAQQLTKIHAIKPHCENIPFIQCPDINPAQYRIRQYRNMLRDIPSHHPVLEYALIWLEDHMPENYDITLCHCDFRTGNYIIHQQKLAAILDWEFTSWSDPYEDIAWFVAKCWRFGNHHLEAGGIAAAKDFFQEYEKYAQIKINQKKIRYWQIVAELRWALIALQQAHRNQKQTKPSLELELTQYMVPEMECNILQYLRT